MRKASSGLKKEIKSLGLDKAKGLKKEKARKASFGFEKEIKQLRAHVSKRLMA